MVDKLSPIRLNLTIKKVHFKIEIYVLFGTLNPRIKPLREL